MEAEAEEEVRGWSRGWAGPGWAGLGFSFSPAPQWPHPSLVPVWPFSVLASQLQASPLHALFSLHISWACPSRSHLILSLLSDKSSSGPTVSLPSLRTKCRLRLQGLWIRVGVY